MMLELHNHARVLKLKAHSLLTIKCTCLDPKDAPSSSSQDSTLRAVRAYSQDAPVLPLKQHLLDPKNAPDGLGSLLDPKTHLRAGSLTGLGRFGLGRSWLKAGFLHA